MPKQLVIGEAVVSRPLTYQLLRADRWPQETLEFRTSIAPIFFTDADDHPTAIRPTSMKGLDPRFTPYVVETVTEHHQLIYANGGWATSYLRKATFHAYHWESEGILIAAASADTVRAFLRSCAEQAGDKVALQPYDVDINKLHGVTPDATYLAMSQETDQGLPYQVRSLAMRGRRLSSSPQAELYRDQGGVASAIQFDARTENVPGWPVAVGREGAVRLLRHIGGWTDPEVELEVLFVSEVWTDVVAPHAKVREVKKRSAKGGDDAGGPAPVKGQKTLDDLLPGDATG